ncbi:MAG TPA: hypothetical protein VFE50_06535 [Cyclobacteriaceae bacterium]|nr:hypothetical protein [Cyclobacteriaceae bacterium]
MKVSETFWLTVVGQIQNAFIAISVVLFFLVPKEKRQPYIQLGLILVCSLISEAIGWTGIFVFHRNMNLAPNLLTIAYLPLTVLLYRKQNNWKNGDFIAYPVIIAFTIFAVINLFFIQGVTGINSYSRALASFLYIIMSITYLFGYAAELPKEVRVKHPMYWISIAIVLYNSIVMYIVIWFEYVVDVLRSNLINMLIVHNMVGLGYYMVFWYAIKLMRR